MNPDVVTAIARLRAAKVLGSAQAALFDRVARRELVSVRFEIRALLYAGVLLLTAGGGLLVKEHHEQIGPWAIAGGIGPTSSSGARFVPVSIHCTRFSVGVTTGKPSDHSFSRKNSKMYSGAWLSRKSR